MQGKHIQPAKHASVIFSSPSNGNSCSSRSSAEEEERLLVARRSAPIPLSSCASGDNSTWDDDGQSTFPKILSCQEKSCCCLSMDVLPGGGGGQQICGWKSRSLAKNSRNSHHNSALSWIMGEAFDLSEVRMKNLVSKKNSNLCERGSKSSVNYLGYMSSTAVNHYPFQHLLDGEGSSLYIKQYRKSYTYRNLDDWMRKMRVGTMSASSSQIKPNVIKLGSEEGQSTSALSSTCPSKRQLEEPAQSHMSRHEAANLPEKTVKSSYETSTASCSNSGSSTRAGKHTSAPPYGSRSWMPPSTNLKQLYLHCAKSIQGSNSQSLRIKPHDQAPRGMHKGVETRTPPHLLLRSDCTKCYKKAVCTCPCPLAMPSQHISPAGTTAHSTLHLAPNVTALRTSPAHHAITNSMNGDRKQLSGRSKNMTSSLMTSSPKVRNCSIIPDLSCLETKRFVGRKPIRMHTTKRRNYNTSVVSSGLYGKLKKKPILANKGQKNETQSIGGDTSARPKF